MAGFLQSSTGEFQNQDGLSTSLKKQALAFLAAWVITVPLLAAGSFALQRMTTSVGGIGALSKRLLTMSGIMSGLYLTTVDWKTVMKDIDENAFTGFAKHLDVVAASLLTIYTTIQLIKTAAGIKFVAKYISPALAAAGAGGTAATTALGAGTAAAAAGVVGTAVVGGAMYGTTKLAEKYLEISRPKEDVELFKGLISAIPTFGNKTPNVTVNNTVNVDKNGNVAIETKKTYDPKNYLNKSETTGKRSPYSNPLIRDL